MDEKLPTDENFRASKCDKISRLLNSQIVSKRYFSRSSLGYVEVFNGNFAEKMPLNFRDNLAHRLKNKQEEWVIPEKPDKLLWQVEWIFKNPTQKL